MYHILVYSRRPIVTAVQFLKFSGIFSVLIVEFLLLSGTRSRDKPCEEGSSVTFSQLLTLVDSHRNVGFARLYSLRRDAIPIISVAESRGVIFLLRSLTCLVHSAVISPKRADIVIVQAIYCGQVRCQVRAGCAYGSDGWVSRPFKPAVTNRSADAVLHV